MKTFVKYLEKTQIVIGIAFLIIFFLTVLLQIISRQLSISIVWTGEVASYSFVWAIFMGAAVMVNRREHFNFNILQIKLKGKKKFFLNLFNDGILILFNLAILYFGIIVVQNFWDYNWTTLPDLKKGYIWISIPIMAGTMMIYSISHVISHIQRFRKGEEQI